MGEVGKEGTARAKALRMKLNFGVPPEGGCAE